MDLRRALDVYVVTTASPDPARGHEEIAAAAIRGGASAIQLRAPELSDEDLLPLATRIATACHRASVVFVVNDRLDVAVASGADGVHLGQGDGLEGARRRLGPDLILGISVGDPSEARAAEVAGADYLGVTVWSTPTKIDAVPRGIDGIKRITSVTSLPVVGIGGIDAANASLVLDAGAAGVAVISAVAAADDPVAATRALARVVASYRAPQQPVGR